ncbi:MAG: hypothetical protein JXA21_15530 [Anaerolineae bacterium]|nr:hypothetical protein [Anaerolineae bacterium]
MLNNSPRRRLRALIQEYGPDIIANTQRSHTLLRNYCAAYPREVNLLIIAQEENIPEQLRMLTTDKSLATQLMRLARRLSNVRLLEAADAEWAVESWALALDITHTHQTSQENVPRNGECPPERMPFLKTENIPQQ